MTLLTVTGCVKNIPADSFCLVFQPIYTSESDTEETLKQVDANNAVYEELCR